MKVSRVALLWLLGACATPAPAPPAAPAPEATSATPAPIDAALAPVAATPAGKDGGLEAPPGYVPFGAGMQTTHLTEKAWRAAARDKLATRLKVDAQSLHFSPLHQWAFVLRDANQPPPAKPAAQPVGKGDPPTKTGKNPKPAAKGKATRAPKVAKPRPRRWEILVVDLEGKRHNLIRPVKAKTGDEPPKDLRFFSEDRLIYEVVEPPPDPNPPPAKKPAPARKAKGNKARPSKPVPPPPSFAAALSPEHLFVIHPIKPRARPVRCSGVGFSFTGKQDRVAYVAGKPEAAYVAVDGEQTFPRKGRSVIASDPVWSKDGHALAFLETPPGAPARLILLAEYDNPNGDNHWVLPAAAHLEGARVFWAGAGKLVVGKTLMRPIFATSFQRQESRTWDP